MKITKYEHACLVIEEEGEALIIDPGIFSNSLPNLTNVKAVVITHVHPDHLDPEKLKNIRKLNPKSMIISVQAVAEQLGPDCPTQIVTGGDKAVAGPFVLNFYGGIHATIHSSYPPAANVGVLVNDTFYYPGDSFVKPDKPVAVLAVPASAPWMKVGEAIDFIGELGAKQVFPTHNAILSPEGLAIHNRMLEASVKTDGGIYSNLDPNQSITL